MVDQHFHVLAATWEIPVHQATKVVSIKHKLLILRQEFCVFFELSVCMEWPGKVNLWYPGHFGQPLTSLTHRPTSQLEMEQTECLNSLYYCICYQYVIHIYIHQLYAIYIYVIFMHIYTYVFNIYHIDIFMLCISTGCRRVTHARSPTRLQAARIGVGWGWQRHVRLHNI